MTAIWKREESVNPRVPALLVIDVQNGFLNRHSRDVVPSVVRLVDGWQTLGAPVALTRFHNEPGSPYEKITGWTKLRTAEEQALVPELSPYLAKASAIIDKGQSSALTARGTQLIQDAGWTDLVLCGLDTDACVYDSAVAAYQNGYRPWIVTDACASTGGPQYHDAALLLAERNLGRDQLINSETALSWVSGTAGACV